MAVAPLDAADLTLFDSLTDRVLNIAHRGARSLAPENTLAAARKALECCADMWELDVMMTACGELVIHHDDSLDRTSNARELHPGRRPWRVRDFTLEELRRLDFGSWFAREDPFGSIGSGAVSLSEAESFIGEPVLTLSEALEFTKRAGWLVNVEMKDLTGAPGHDVIVEKTVACIEKLKMEGRVLLSSFNHSYLLRAKALNPGIAAGALVKSLQADPLGLLRGLNAEAYHPRDGAFRLEDLPLLRKEGRRALVWVVNEENRMRELIRAGVDGIFTDFPQLLNDLLKKQSRMS